MDPNFRQIVAEALRRSPGEIEDAYRAMQLDPGAPVPRRQRNIPASQRTAPGSGFPTASRVATDLFGPLDVGSAWDSAAKSAEKSWWGKTVHNVGDALSEGDIEAALKGTAPAFAAAAQLFPAGSYADALGVAPDINDPTKMAPSMAENVRQGNVGTAALQGAGVAADTLGMMTSPIAAVFAGLSSDVLRRFFQTASKMPGAPPSAILDAAGISADVARADPGTALAVHALENPSLSIQDLHKWSVDNFGFSVFQAKNGQFFREFPDVDPLADNIDDLISLQNSGLIKNITLPDAWPRSDDLYDFVPKLRGTRMEFMFEDPNIGGSTAPSGKSMSFNRNMGEWTTPKNTMAHETTHAAASLQGKIDGALVANGTSPEAFYYPPNRLPVREREIREAANSQLSDTSVPLNDRIMGAYQSALGEYLARMSGNRAQLYEAGLTDIYDQSPLLTGDRIPNETIYRKSEQSINPMLPQFDEYWKSTEYPPGIPEANKRLQEAADLDDPSKLFEDTRQSRGLTISDAPEDVNPFGSMSVNNTDDIDKLLADLRTNAPEDQYIAEANRILTEGAGPRVVGGTDMMDPVAKRLSDQMDQGNRDIQAFAQKTRPDIAENDNIAQVNTADPAYRERWLRGDVEKRKNGMEIIPDQEELNYTRGAQTNPNPDRGERMPPRQPRAAGEWVEIAPGVRVPVDSKVQWDKGITDSPNNQYVDVDPEFDTPSLEKLRQTDETIRGLTDGLSDDDIAMLSFNTYHGSPSLTPIKRFDRRVIGTNDGITEGWGVYSGQNPQVANTYRVAREDYGSGGKGYLHKLKLPGEPEEYLRFDIPLYMQPPDLIDALKARGINPDDFKDGDSRRWLRALSRTFEPDPSIPAARAEAERMRMASEYLNQATGRPGFRYLDQGSRPTVSVDVHDAKIMDIESAIERFDQSGRPKSDPFRITLERRLADARKARMQYVIDQQQRAKEATYNFVNFVPEDVKVEGATLGDSTDFTEDFAMLSRNPDAALTNINQRLVGLGTDGRKTSVGGDRYVGAPPGVNTPEAEQALIASVMGRVTSEPGLAGKDFYTNYQQMIRGNTSDPRMARDLASITGHTSPQTTPLLNHNYGVKGLNQQTVGADIDTGTFHNTNAARIRASLESGRLPDDPKTGQYTYNILPPELRPKDFADYAPVNGRTDRPVHDTWDFRAFGYPDNGSGNLKRHEYMDAIYDEVIKRLNADPKTRALAGLDGWNVENAQAAVWASIRDEAQKAGEKIPEVNPASEIDAAAKGFTQMAAVYGPSTGGDPRLLTAPLDMKRAYTDAIFKAIEDESGASKIARSLGLSGEMREGFGPWQGMMEPNRVIDIGVAGEGSGPTDTFVKKTGKTSPARRIDAASDLVARTMRRWHQIALGQEGSGFTFPYSAQSITDKYANLGVVDGVPLVTQEDYGRAFEAAKGIWGDGFADKVVIQPTADGRLMLKDISGDIDGFNKGMKQFAEAMGGTASNARDVGNQFDFALWDISPEEAARRSTPDNTVTSYRTLLDETRDNPKLKAIFDEKVVPVLKDIQVQSDAWAKKMGISADAVPDRLRRIITSAGSNWPAAIDDAVKKGIIPAFVGIAVFEALQDDLDPSGGSQSSRNES